MGAVGEIFMRGEALGSCKSWDFGEGRNGTCEARIEGVVR
jgi:hypothetical protein